NPCSIASGPKAANVATCDDASTPEVPAPGRRWLRPFFAQRTIFGVPGLRVDMQQHFERHTERNAGRTIDDGRDTDDVDVIRAREIDRFFLRTAGRHRVLRDQYT